MNPDNSKSINYGEQVTEHHVHFGELDATMFADTDPVLGPNRALGVFGRSDSGPNSSLFMSPDHSEDRSAGVMGMPPTAQLSRLSMASEENSVFHAMKKPPALEVVGSSSNAAAGSADITFPEKPCFVVRTHFSTQFESCKDTRAIVQFMDATLQNFPEFDFCFFPPPEGESMWKGKYVRSAKACEVYVRVYADGAGKYIVEGNRVKGDSKPFMTFYKEFKALVTGTPVVRRDTSMLLAPLPSQALSDEEFLGGIAPIFTMTQDVCMEPRCEGVKMLCELATQETHLLRLESCMDQVTLALENLVGDEMEDVRQHAIMAVANFVNLVDIPAYKTRFIASTTMLQQILLFAQDAPAPVYDSIQARRECAHILYMLSEMDAAGTLCTLEQAVGSGLVRRWMDSAVYAKDARMKTYMSDARDNFLRQKK